MESLRIFYKPVQCSVMTANNPTVLAILLFEKLRGDVDRIFVWVWVKLQVHQQSTQQFCDLRMCAKCIISDETRSKIRSKDSFEIISTAAFLTCSYLFRRDSDLTTSVVRPWVRTSVRPSSKPPNHQ